MIETKEKLKIKALKNKLIIIKGIPIIEIPNKKIKLIKKILPIKLLIRPLL